MSNPSKKNLQQERLRIYGLYSQLIEGIKHYDNIQTICRSMASTLLLASFAVIGFLFTLKANVLHIDNLICVIFTGVLSLVGITALGLLDLVFQERLLIANFVSAVHLEDCHKWLPSAHNNMLQKGSHHGSPIRKAIFYVGCSVCLFAVIGSTTFLLYGLESLVNSILIPFLTILSAAFYGFMFSRVTGRFEVLAEKLLKEPTLEQKK